MARVKKPSGLATGVTPVEIRGRPASTALAFTCPGAEIMKAKTGVKSGSVMWGT